MRHFLRGASAATDTVISSIAPMCAHSASRRIIQLRFGAAAIPFLVGTAWAAPPLSDAQMDAVTAGGAWSADPLVVAQTDAVTAGTAFSAFAIADAQASGKVVATSTGTVAEVGPVLTPNGMHVTIGFGEALPDASPLIIQGMQHTGAQ